MMIVGAAPESLGEAVFQVASEDYDFASVNTAGIAGEQVKLDVTHGLRIKEVLQQVRPDIVVCTVGVNVPAGVDDPYLMTKMADSFMTNVTGPLTLLSQFVTSEVRPERVGMVKKFVAISSNSARIPRRGSIPYCASKAGLSMALRVAARELAGRVLVWGYEPGLLAGTPMTRQTEKDSLGVVLHRMRGVDPEGIPVRDLAARIVYDAATFSVAQNGLMIPFDADEL